ncbi:MAG: hypothetical protein K2V38_28720 [Gemmataceae bacterium]|nr:hypothetical protein [Gemmataceae bacterium]
MRLLWVAVWKKALEGWNVLESKVLNRLTAEMQAYAKAQGLTEGRAEGRAEQAATLVAVLEAKFGSIPSELEAGIRAVTDLATLRQWNIEAAKAATLADFRTAAGL